MRATQRAETVQKAGSNASRRTVTEQQQVALIVNRRKVTEQQVDSNTSRAIPSASQCLHNAAQPVRMQNKAIEQALLQQNVPLAKNRDSHPGKKRPFQPVKRQERSSFYSGSVSGNTRERVRKRTPSGPSSENIPPRPFTTSMMSCVCFQYSYCALPM